MLFPHHLLQLMVWGQWARQAGRTFKQAGAPGAPAGPPCRAGMKISLPMTPGGPITPNKPGAAAPGRGSLLDVDC